MSHLHWDPDRCADYQDELANARWSRWLTWEEYQHALDVREQETHPYDQEGER